MNPTSIDLLSPWVEFRPVIGNVGRSSWPWRRFRRHYEKLQHECLEEIKTERKDRTFIMPGITIDIP